MPSRLLGLIYILNVKLDYLFVAVRLLSFTIRDYCIRMQHAFISMLDFQRSLQMFGDLYL